MAADAAADGQSRPFPEDADNDQALGRMASATGNPIRSRPVILAIRVMPASRIKGRRFSRVCVGETARCVPSNQVFFAVSNRPLKCTASAGSLSSARIPDVPLTVSVTLNAAIGQTADVRWPVFTPGCGQSNLVSQNFHPWVLACFSSFR